MPISATGHRKKIGTFDNKTREYNPPIIQKKINNIARSQQEKAPSKLGGITALYALSAILPHLKMVVNSTAQMRDDIVLYTGTPQNTSRQNGGSDVMAAWCNDTLGRNTSQADSRLASALNRGFTNIIPKETTMRSNHFYQMGHSAAEFLLHSKRKFDELVSEYDPLRFPAADATYISTPFLSQNTGHWDNNIHLFIIDNASDKEKFVESLTQFLVTIGQLAEQEAEKFVILIKKDASGFPLLITPVIKIENELSRTKRISEADRHRYIGEHIKEHCAFETEVLNTKGENEGKVLIFQAQRAENPFRMIYDNTDVTPSPVVHGVASGLNFLTDILTLGLKPLIGNLIGNSLRKKYYLSLGDDICATRQDHLSIAELATAVNVEGLAFVRRGKTPITKPNEMMHSVPLPDRAAYSLRNPFTGVQQELLIKIVDNKKAAIAIRDGDDGIYLKPTGQGEFVTYNPHASKAELPEKRVIVNEEKSTWRYADHSDAPDLSVQFSEGKSFIHLQGEKHELRINRHRQYEVAVHKLSGATEYLPVYREPLSQEWHLDEYNGHSVFNTRQKYIIYNYNTPINKRNRYVAERNANQKRYGSGIIYRVENTEEPSNEIMYKAIEMNGMVVPVRERITPKNRLHYDIYDIGNNSKETYPVEFDGARWLFEHPTSIHASHSLKKAVTDDMLIDMDASQLSAPGQKGLRWDTWERSYLKVDNKYLQIKKLNGNRYCIIKPIKGKRIYLRYHNEKFSIETARERLNNILTEGLSGRKRKYALDVLKEQDGFSEDSARELLLEYQFPKGGFYDDYNFVLEIEQSGKIPRWADQFKKSIIAQKTVSVFTADNPGHFIELNMGKKLGEGGYGTVFADADNNNFVIKKYVINHENIEGDIGADIDFETLSTNEVNSFRRYYGEDSATLYQDGEGGYFMRMYRVPGKTISQLPPNSLPPDAVDRYVDMLEKLNHVGILHSDLHEGNIIWDEEAEIFHPIDIYNIKDQFFRAGGGDTFQDGIDEDEWNYLIEDITNRMKSADQV